MYSPNTSPKKPSPLSYGSPRASPFKRPTSAAGSQGSPSSAPRTPGQASRSGGSGPPPAPHTPTRNPHTISEEDDVTDIFTAPTYPTHSPSGRSSPRGAPALQSPQRELPPTPSTSNAVPAARHVPIMSGSQSDAASKVAPGLLREMHESFQAMDQDDDGQVDAADVTEALAQLGQNAHPATLTTFFPPGSASSVSLPNYINTLSSPLAAMSAPAELAAAFSAFDADDSGQIDVTELREALIASYDGSPGLKPQEVDAIIGEFAGKRAFSRGQTGKRGDVFKWREFVSATSGASSGSTNDKQDGSVGVA